MKCIMCDEEAKQEIWVGYFMCGECVGKLDTLSMFQCYMLSGEAGIVRALEDIKNGRKCASGK